jgi:hypothetical protein
MEVVKRFVARSAAELDEISGRAHDGVFDPEELRFDDEAAVVELPFANEPHDVEPRIPAAVHVRSTWRYEEYALPFIRAVLTVHEATALRAPDPDDMDELIGIRYDEERGLVCIWTGMLIDVIEIDVDALHVELAVTDEIQSVKRRRVGRLHPWDSTSNWPAACEAELKARILAREGPAPAPHEVSAIVRREA